MISASNILNRIRLEKGEKGTRSREEFLVTSIIAKLDYSKLGSIKIEVNAAKRRESLHHGLSPSQGAQNLRMLIRKDEE